MVVKQRNYSHVLTEGWVYATVFIVAALLAQRFAGTLQAVPLWLLSGFVLFIYRDPKREVPSAPLAIVSPADGIVTGVETVSDPYLDRTSIRITVKMGFWSVYLTRSPTEGKIMERWFISRKQQQPDGDEPGKRFGIWVQTDEQDDVVVVMTKRLPLNYPQCHVQSGERIGQGQRCGFIRFGATVDTYVPENSKINVQVGDRVYAGASTIGVFVHK